MLSQEDFYDRAKDFALLKDVEGKYFTFDEYKQLIKDNQTDKDGQLIYLYANNKEEEYSYIEAAKIRDIVYCCLTDSSMFLLFQCLSRNLRRADSCA